MSANYVSPGKPRIWPLWWLEKQGPLFFSSKISFSTYFLLKIPRKHLRNIVKPIHGHQNANIPSQNPLETKILSKLRYVVLGVFKVKKPKHNPPHYMEPFDTKNQPTEIFPNDHFLSLGRNSETPSLFSQQKKTEKREK